MQWSSAWYGAHCFQNLKWGLQSGQDFAVGDRKVGGNAQSFGGGRWVHHTSFLHDFDYKVMSEMLTLPKKQPDWRQHRDHRCCECQYVSVHVLTSRVTFIYQRFFDYPS
jgi:lipoate-protein ligase A